MLDKLLRTLPEFKGKHRIARLLYNGKIQHAEDVTVKGRYGCTYLLPNLVENVGQDIFINGVYEQETVDFIEKLIPPGGYFMDMGANIGAILIPLCTRRKDIHALGVEAAPWVYEYLQKNIRLNNLTNIQVLNNALLNEDDLTLDFFSPRDKYGKGSLSAVFSKEPIKVISKKADTIIKECAFPRVDAIKADVEGFEYFVFKGAEQLLSADPAPDIVFEFVDWAERAARDLEPGSAQRLLLEKGYTLYLLEKDRPVKLDNYLTSGSFNLFASKKPL